MTQLHVFASPAELAEGCAAFIATAAEKAVAKRGQFNIALSGGSTPAATYRKLSGPDGAHVDWQHTHIFWVDERCVPAEHADSNYGMAKRTLLDRVSIPGANIHRMRGELPPAEGALAYRQELADQFGKDGIPSFDLILLGLGEDGHTASLFPGSSALGAGDELIVANFLPKMEAWRLTMTFPLINAAQHIVFLVSGENKSKIVKDVVEGTNTRLPAAAVRPRTGNPDWFLDQAAAQFLSGQMLSD
ncbi:MAG: 6-phosphogluconolactonase [Anaerolineales bacterium]